MIDADIFYAKLSNIQNCLRRIRDVTHLDPELLDELNIQDIFVLNLQRTIQSSIDLAAHVVAAEELGLPSSLKDNFVLLERAGILTKDETLKMSRMVGFRNIAVHDYQNLDLAVLKSILVIHLPDIEEFTRRLLDHYGL